jgi:Rieske Fe-S protein
MNVLQNCAGCLSRRRLFAAGALGAAAALAGCSTYGNEAAAPAPPAPASSTGAGDGARASSPDDGGAKAIATLSDVPVGGAKIVGDVVLTQPVAGTVAAFSATCTHAGCAVNEISDGKIKCPCHGSAFNLDGSVAKGPATRALPPVKVSVTGEAITLG